MESVDAQGRSSRLLLECAELLFSNGETTERTHEATSRMARALGVEVRLFLRWDELSVGTEGRAGWHYETIAARPAGVDMAKVTATVNLVDKLCDGLLLPIQVLAALEAIRRSPPASITRFAIMAAAGAAALGVIFGAAHASSLLLIALSAGAGACVRRGLASVSHNLFVQPFCASLLAGVIGAIVVHLQLSSSLRLVAVCPCMVLVPGPHLLNGALDLVRGRIGLGISRIAYACLIIVMICAGLLFGLSAGGVALPVSGSSSAVPLGYDVIAAGIAVAAYGSFFNMPWSTLPIPTAVGMLAHAARWTVITLGGASAEQGALIACLIAGIIITPLADRLKLPFAAFAFASVVSLIPGIFVFRMASGAVQLVAPGTNASPELLLATITDGTTAALIMLAMAFGLIFPKLLIGRLYPRIGGTRDAKS